MALELFALPRDHLTILSRSLLNLFELQTLLYLLILITKLIELAIVSCSLYRKGKMAQMNASFKDDRVI